MGITVNLRGEGDMKMSTYDSDKDGVILKAQLDTDLMDKATYDSDLNGKFALAQLEPLSIGLNKTSPSDVEKTAYDTEYTLTQDASMLFKTFTFSKEVVGTVRLKIDLHRGGDGHTSKAQWKKGGVNKGSHHAPVTQNDWTSFSEDVDVGKLAYGETLELYLDAVGFDSACRCKNIKILYDHIVFPDIVVS